MFKTSSWSYYFFNHSLDSRLLLSLQAGKNGKRRRKAWASLRWTFPLPPGGRFSGVGKEEKRGTRQMTFYLNVSGKHCWSLSSVTDFPVYCFGGIRSLRSPWCETRFQIATGELMGSSKLWTGLLIPTALQLVLACYKPQGACLCPICEIHDKTTVYGCIFPLARQAHPETISNT